MFLTIIIMVPLIYNGHNARTNMQFDQISFWVCCLPFFFSFSYYSLPSIIIVGDNVSLCMAKLHHYFMCGISHGCFNMHGNVFIANKYTKLAYMNISLLPFATQITHFPPALSNCPSN